MSRYTLDLIFDERTGDVKVVVDLHDPSMTPLEINQAIRDGEVREELLGVIERLLGAEVAARVRRGETEMVCLDDHPELRPGRREAAAEGGEEAERQALEQ